MKVDSENHPTVSHTDLDGGSFTILKTSGTRIVILVHGTHAWLKVLGNHSLAGPSGMA